jgi:hypothetical protein
MRSFVTVKLNMYTIDVRVNHGEGGGKNYFVPRSKKSGKWPGIQAENTQMKISQVERGRGYL